MGREATITYEQVAAVADSIEAQKGNASSRNVREVLGCGSMSTICKLLQQRKNNQTRESQTTIDDRVDPAISRAIADQIANRVQKSIAEATIRVAELQSEMDILINENEHLSSENDLLETERTSLEQQRAALYGRIQQLEADAKITATDLASERRASEGTRVELAKAMLRLELVPQIEEKLKQITDELSQSRSKAAEQHEVAAVANAKLEAAGREIVVAQDALISARLEAKKSADDAAQLRGQLVEAKAKYQPPLHEVKRS